MAIWPEDSPSFPIFPKQRFSSSATTSTATKNESRSRPSQNRPPRNSDPIKKTKIRFHPIRFSTPFSSAMSKKENPLRISSAPDLTKQRSATSSEKSISTNTNEKDRKSVV